MREVGEGQPPTPRQGLQATMVDNIVFVTGGLEWPGMDDDTALTSILSWDPSTESWQTVGDLAVGRHLHAAVSIPSLLIMISECSAMP